MFFFLNAADDMGLGKTLTMISLILTKKANEKGENEKKEVKKPEKWISKTGNYWGIISNFSLLKQTKAIAHLPFRLSSLYGLQIPPLWLPKALWSSVLPPWSTTGSERLTDTWRRPSWACAFTTVPTERKELQCTRISHTFAHLLLNQNLVFKSY